MAILVEIDLSICRKPNLTNTDSCQPLQSVFESDVRLRDLRRVRCLPLKALNFFGARWRFP